MDDLKLIREVQKRAFFYTKGLSGYRNSKLRNKAWIEIGRILKSSGEECCSRWRVIRDRYVKLIAKKAENISINEFVTKWELYKHLEFLQAHIQPRIQKRRLKDSISNDEADEALMSLPATVYEDNCSDALPIEIAKVESLPETFTHQPEVPMQLNVLEEKLSTFMNNVEKLLNQRQDHKNEAFYRIVSAKLAELPEDEQEDAKLFIISHVFEKVKAYKQQMKCSK